MHQGSWHAVLRACPRRAQTYCSEKRSLPPPITPLAGCLASGPSPPPLTDQLHQLDFSLIDMAPREKKERKSRSALSDVITREYTVHLHKHIHGQSFKKRAPKAIKAVTEFAQKAMGTNDVRIDPGLNAAIWNRGIRNVPRRIRIRLARLRHDDEDSKEKLYTLATFVDVPDFKGLNTQVVENDDA
ncbi:hypothetical protein O181_005723 [Austropuccinia psidii MF-1]|uniref:60S ribosomal protein L31 n=1 Tax=Austropuccinia psidii MF-1 TaxID=1389203 RepID=A0A9Q3BIT4_9BASI|nr:hypothetical protein [Austropuccinia psidii MF-1]